MPSSEVVSVVGTRKHVDKVALGLRVFFPLIEFVNPLGIVSGNSDNFDAVRGSRKVGRIALGLGFTLGKN